MKKLTLIDLQSDTNLPSWINWIIPSLLRCNAVENAKYLALLAELFLERAEQLQIEVK